MKTNLYDEGQSPGVSQVSAVGDGRDGKGSGEACASENAGHPQKQVRQSGSSRGCSF